MNDVVPFYAKAWITPCNCHPI